MRIIAFARVGAAAVGEFAVKVEVVAAPALFEGNIANNPSPRKGGGRAINS